MAELSAGGDQVPVDYVGGCPAGSWVCESAGQEGALSRGQRWGGHLSYSDVWQGLGYG